jgi:hypothetical protein
MCRLLLLVNAVVYQASNIGSTLFPIFINDFQETTTNSSHSFAYGSTLQVRLPVGPLVTSRQQLTDSNYATHIIFSCQGY